MQAHFLKLKSNLEPDPSFSANVSTRHRAVREYLANNHPGFKDSKLIGSLQRQTRVNPGATQNCDIDILVIMGEFTGWVQAGGITPDGAIESLRSTVNDSPRYNDMNPVPDAPTVALTGADGLRVELVPAYIDNIGVDPSGQLLGHVGRGYWVPKEGRWQMADYDYEAQWISDLNKTSNSYLIPVIKMVKAIKSKFFRSLGSFPLEIMVARIVPDRVVNTQLREEDIAYENLILDVFRNAPALLTTPIKVSNSKSAPMILGEGLKRSTTETFGKLVRYIEMIQRLDSEAKQVEAWRELFGDFFPVTIQ